MSPCCHLFLYSWHTQQFIIQGETTLFHFLACFQNKFQTPQYSLRSLNIIRNLSNQSDFNSCPSFLPVELSVLSEKFSSSLIYVHLTGDSHYFVFRVNINLPNLSVLSVPIVNPKVSLCFSDNATKIYIFIVGLFVFLFPPSLSLSFLSPTPFSSLSVWSTFLY